MNFISGKEALIALANGKEVELRGGAHYDWKSASNCVVEHFLQESFEFRIKPRTINLNGIEVPAPFEPKPSDIFYYISDEHDSGFSHSTVFCEIKKDRWIGVWRTEEEIKQVVDTLRKVIKGPQQ